MAKQKLSNRNKKDIVVFLAGGLAAFVIHKLEAAINEKADDYFGPDEEKPKKKSKKK